MNTDMTLKKAEAALDVILEYDEKDADVGFRQVLDEIITRWKDGLQ